MITPMLRVFWALFANDITYSTPTSEPNRRVRQTVDSWISVFNEIVKQDGNIAEGWRSVTNWILWDNEKLRYRRGTARRAVSVKTVRTTVRRIAVYKSCIRRMTYKVFGRSLETARIGNISGV